MTQFRASLEAIEGMSADLYLVLGSLTAAEPESDEVSEAILLLYRALEDIDAAVIALKADNEKERA